MSDPLSYIAGYSPQVVEQVQQLLATGKLRDWFERRYPSCHQITTEKALFAYTIAIKNQYMRKASPLSKVVYDGKIHLINNALGLHSYVSRVQGAKLKAKNEIRIASLFRQAPEPLLRMLVVHELAHLKEKQHDKAFYSLCTHMLPDYHQLEFDARLFVILSENP